MLADTDKAGCHIGTLVMDGTGTQTLTGNNTYTGPTTVLNGTLALTGDTKSPTFTLGSGAATLDPSPQRSLSYSPAPCFSSAFDGGETRRIASPCKRM
ncbi:autotransporter-associated beta strand repeat-containing protein [Verrucomicrobiota bacterium sgz303538]